MFDMEDSTTITTSFPPWTPPFGQQKYAVPKGMDIKNMSLEYGIINDYGGLSEIQTVNF